MTTIEDKKPIDATGSGAIDGSAQPGRLTESTAGEEESAKKPSVVGIGACADGLEELMLAMEEIIPTAVEGTKL